MRGKYALAKLEPTPNLIPAQKSRKGRSEELLERRNEVILYRYYYYVKIKRMRYEDIITVLGKEFFLAERTTVDLLMKSSDELSNIYKKQANENELQKLFPFLNWKI